MYGTASLRLSRPVYRLCYLPCSGAGGTTIPQKLPNLRFSKFALGRSNYTNGQTCPENIRLPTSQFSIVRNSVTKLSSLEGARYSCGQPLVKVLDLPYRCSGRLGQPLQLSKNQILRFFSHSSQSFVRHEGKIINTQVFTHGSTSSNLLHFGAFIVGITLFTYGRHYFGNDEFKLSSYFTKPVYAGSDFHKNNFIADVVEKAGSAVVFLEIKGRHPLTGRPVTLSNGSGFVVRPNGIILTNAHVVANKSSVSVKLQDGRVFEGQVTAVDPISDLAAVKISASGLPTIPLGNSSDIRPGEWVIAMGSPLSLSNTVTCGIVSSVQRASKELGLRNKNMDYIQTDAVINFGNSGGPLVNLDGKAIGINTMKVTTGISFAIPSDYAVKFLTKAEALMKNGKTENGFLKRRYMGITMLTLTESVMRDLRNNVKMPNFADVKGGVFVYKVIPGSPAHLGGILAGDIIIEISGVSIRSAADVYDAVEKGDHLKVTVIRGSDKKVIPINTQETI